MKTLISADNTWALFAILVVVAALAIWMGAEVQMGRKSNRLCYCFDWSYDSF